MNSFSWSTCYSLFVYTEEERGGGDLVNVQSLPPTGLDNTVGYIQGIPNWEKAETFFSQLEETGELASVTVIDLPLFQELVSQKMVDYWVTQELTFIGYSGAVLSPFGLDLEGGHKKGDIIALKQQYQPIILRRSSPDEAIEYYVFAAHNTKDFSAVFAARQDLRESICIEKEVAGLPLSKKELAWWEKFQAKKSYHQPVPAVV